MSLKRKVAQRAQRRALRVRAKLRGTGIPRVSVFRSNKYIYAQVIDDAAHHTVASCSSLELDGLSGDKRSDASAVGRELAKRALAVQVSKVVFDRGSCLYHGRVKALADGLREGGLTV